MENSLSTSDSVDLHVQRFEAAEEATFNARAVSERCRDYRDGKQLSEEEIRELKRRGQPPIVVNRIRRKVDWLLGLEMQSRTDPRAFPRTPKHEQGAEAATDAIRYVCDNTDFDKKRSSVWENMLVEGFGGVEVIHKFKPPMTEPEIVINHYPWDRLFYDPHSRAADFSDARYKGVVIWQDADQLKREYPKHKAHFDEILLGHSLSDTFEDRPAFKVWGDRSRKRIRIVLTHWLDGDVWKWCKFTKGQILDEGESPYVDENGQSECCLIMQSAYVDRENNRYGIVKDMLDVQDEVNKRRSKALHLLNSRQTIGVKGAVDSVAAMKREMAKPDGHVEINPEVMEDAARAGMKALDRVDTSDFTAGQLALLQEAKQEIDLMGANAGLAGKEEGNDQSGRAILAKQQGGMIEIAPLTDQLSHFTRTVYRSIWNRIRQFWKEEKWIRVTDDERNVRFVGLNQPVTLQDQLAQLPDEQVVMAARQMGLFPNDPRLSAVVSVDNAVEEIDVDILLEEVPDVVSLQGETVENLINLATSMPGSVPPEILIEAMPGIKRDVKDKLLERLEQQAAQQQEMQQAALQAEQAESQRKDMETQGEVMKDQASAEKDRADAFATIAELYRPQPVAGV